MNRKVIALAIAGALAAPAAFADNSSVTLTGVINGSLDFIENEPANLDSKPAIGSNATRFQIDGSEDLGWSKAIFSLAVDQAFAGPGSISNGPGAGGLGDLENRNSYIGLTGGWGTLRWGQNEHQYEIQQIIQDPWPASENFGNALTLMTKYHTLGAVASEGFTRREPQSIWYTSPNLGGFVLDLAYITGNGIKANVGGGPDPKGYQIAGQYNLGGWLDLFAAYATYDDMDFVGIVAGIPGAPTEDEAFRVGAGLMFGGLRIDVAYEKLEHTNSTAAPFDLKRDNFYVAAGFKLGAGTIRAQYAKGDEWSGSVCGLGATICPESGETAYGIGYGHGLSKRTEAFVYWAKVDRDLPVTPTATGIGVAGGNTTGFSFGVRHSF